MRALLLAALMAPGAAWAQEDVCAATWARLAVVTETALGGTARAAGEGWCEVREVTLGAPEGVGVQVVAEVVRWRGDGIGAFADGTGLPTALEAGVGGLRVLTRTGDPGLDWLLDVQQARAGIDGAVALTWDRDALTLTVDALDLDFPGRNAVAATATLSRIDLSSMAAARTSLGSVSLDALAAEVEMEGLFESYLLMPLAGPFLARGYGAQEGFEALQAQALDEVARLPPALFVDGAPDALAGFMRALPNPTGVLTLDVAAEPGRGLGPGRFAVFALTGLPSTPAEFWPVLQGLEIRLGWESRPPSD